MNAVLFCAIFIGLSYRSADSVKFCSKSTATTEKRTHIGSQIQGNYTAACIDGDRTVKLNVSVVRNFYKCSNTYGLVHAYNVVSDYYATGGQRCHYLRGDVTCNNLFAKSSKKISLTVDCGFKGNCNLRYSVRDILRMIPLNGSFKRFCRSRRPSVLKSRICSAGDRAAVNINISANVPSWSEWKSSSSCLQNKSIGNKNGYVRWTRYCRYPGKTIEVDSKLCGKGNTSVVTICNGTTVNESKQWNHLSISFSHADDDLRVLHCSFACEIVIGVVIVFALASCAVAAWCNCKVRKEDVEKPLLEDDTILSSIPTEPLQFTQTTNFEGPSSGEIPSIEPVYATITNKRVTEISSSRPSSIGAFSVYTFARDVALHKDRTADNNYGETSKFSTTSETKETSMTTKDDVDEKSPIYATVMKNKNK